MLLWNTPLLLATITNPIEEPTNSTTVPAARSAAARIWSTGRTSAVDQASSQPVSAKVAGLRNDTGPATGPPPTSASTSENARLTPHTWLILLTLTTGRVANQRELAAAVGIEGATLTHYLNAMERDGLLSRHRDPGNRRVHQVVLTDAGQDAFRRMRAAAATFDKRLRAGLDDADAAALAGLLDRLSANVADADR